jgi:hypothetical protein
LFNTGDDGKGGETQYPSYCRMDLHASARHVAFSAIAQKATPAVTSRSHCGAEYPFL